jgi:RNA polymerase sigma-70 factor (ECF subfamily)
MNHDLEPSQWLARYGDYLFSLAFLKLNNREAAEDMVQDTFVSALKARDSFRKESSEKTWLVSILNNKIIDHYRKKDVLKNADSYLSETESSFGDHFFDANTGHWLDNAGPAEWKETADKKVNRNEFYKIIRYCVEKMPPKLVPVFLAKFLEDEDSEKICKDLKITPSNYWVIIHRAKVLMRSCLEKNWFLR